MEANAVIMATNGAKLTTVLRSKGFIIDWTPPVITDVVVQTTGQLNHLSLSANWVPLEMESTVSDCLWAIG